MWKIAPVVLLLFVGSDQRPASTRKPMPKVNCIVGIVGATTPDNAQKASIVMMADKRIVIELPPAQSVDDWQGELRFMCRGY